MSPRIAHRLAKTSGQAPCARCLGVVDVRAGEWIACEPDGPAAVCDHCARDDATGYAALVAWRRAAAGPATGRRRAA